ncbi:hypothetical protein FOVSG1_011439 [Fusarium oxysporum f. sp. vasinfectum]
MSGQAQGRKIAITGSSGHVGRPTIEGLLAQGIHTITIVQRIEATSTFPPEVMVKSGDLKDESLLTSAFQDKMLSCSCRLSLNLSVCKSQQFEQQQKLEFHIYYLQSLVQTLSRQSP